MKHILIIFILLFTLFLGSCEDNGENIEIFIQKQPSAIAGRVYPFDAEATVGLYQGIVMLIAETNTNPDGTFIIENVPPGVYLEEYDMITSVEKVAFIHSFLFFHYPGC